MAYFPHHHNDSQLFWADCRSDLRIQLRFLWYPRQDESIFGQCLEASNAINGHLDIGSFGFKKTHADFLENRFGTVALQAAF